MTKGLGGFDWIADQYDFLARLIFGNAIFESQIFFLRAIPGNARILVLGGGTGRMLKPLLQGDPACEICYIEASRKMLAHAYANTPVIYRTRVQFIHGTQEAVPQNARFDIIITNFFLDVFPGNHLLGHCAKLNGYLDENGIWYVTDFCNGPKLWQRILLWTMYRFFYITCRIVALKLPPWEETLTSLGYEECQCKYFYGGFVKTVIYRSSHALD